MVKAKTSKKQKTLVLLDAHAVLHRAFHALPAFTSPKGEPTGALYGFTAMLIKIIRELKPDYLVACYDLPEPTFRHTAYEEYKAKRPKIDDDLVAQINRSRDILDVFGIPVYDAPGFEADDVIGTVVNQVKKLNAKRCTLKAIIASGDMDTLQLVKDNSIVVYTLKKGMNDTIIYDEDQVKERFGFGPEFIADFKGIKGDPSDNIIGVPGIGDKGATTLIQQFGTIEDIYKNIKKNEQKLLDKGIKQRTIELLKEHEEDALFSKELATIRLDAPIKFKTDDAEWNKNFDRTRAEDVLRNFGFMSLVGRLPKGDEAEDKEGKKTPSVSTGDDKELEKKLAVAVWLLDSRNTTPDIADILNFAGAKSLRDAEKNLIPRLKKENLYQFFSDVELPLISILDEMQKTGIMIDKKILENLSRQYEKEITSLEKKIWKMAGIKFNVASPKQLAEVLYDKMGISVKGIRKTGGGARSTKFSELEKLVGEHPIASLVIKFRELSKLKSTYIDVLPRLADEGSRIHSTLNQTGTVTGRFSSQDPNLQNIPIKSEAGREIRRAFVAPEGWRLLACDYSQIELRVAAMATGDKVMKEVFLSGEDIHSATAAKIFDVSPNDVTRDMRRMAKVINFGILYGMGVRTLAGNLKISMEEAQNFYDKYFERFEGMKRYVEATKKKAQNLGYVETMFGRRRYFPELKRNLPEYVKSEFLRMAVNAPLQGTASDIIKIAMVNINKKLKKDKKLSGSVKMILQIHDELLFEVRDDSVKDAAIFIKKEMEEAYTNDVPIVADVLAGPNLAELDAVKGVN